MVARATRHIDFCCGLYSYQFKQSKHFIHEHPRSARSWSIDGIKELTNDLGVSSAYSNMCHFGMTTHIDVRDGQRGLVAKPTGFMTSSWTAYEEFNKTCRDTHVRVPLVGGRASACREYPPALCAAMCRGIAKQKAYSAGGDTATCPRSRKQLLSFMTKVVDPAHGRKIRVHNRHRLVARPIGEWSTRWFDHVHEHDGGSGEHGTRPCDGVAEIQGQVSALYDNNGMPEAWDDMNNVFLEPDMVAAARAEEMSFFKKLGVYRRVPRAMIKQVGGKLGSVKWLDTNKGDRSFRNYRFRLVAREYTDSKDDTLYTHRRRRLKH